MTGFYDELFTAPDTLKYFVKGEWKVSRAARRCGDCLMVGCAYSLQTLKGSLQTKASIALAVWCLFAALTST